MTPPRELFFKPEDSNMSGRDAMVVKGITIEQANRLVEPLLASLEQLKQDNERLRADVKKLGDIYLCDENGNEYAQVESALTDVQLVVVDLEEKLAQHEATIAKLEAERNLAKEALEFYARRNWRSDGVYPSRDMAREALEKLSSLTLREEKKK
jgi:cell division protein FtsB